MIITENTNIAALFRENKESIRVISSINPHFEKLKNPILRKTLGKRVSIKDAARIGKTSPQTILEKLRKIGFEIDPIEEEQKKQEAGSKDIPSWIHESVKQTLDVRNQITRGKDPMKKILAASKKMNPGEVFLLINSFEPLPMISLLKEKGFDHYLHRKDKQLVYTYFRKMKEKSETSEEVINYYSLNEEDFRKKLATFGEKLDKLDVRDLEMPGPMVSILEKTETLPSDTALYVHHKKMPVYLLPELQNRNFKVYGFPIDENNIDLIIIKNKDART